jgi:hypothetical protein
VAALSPQYATWVAITDRTEAPNKLRQFARACGVLAKNDRLDARLIAEYVAIMRTRVVHALPMLIISASLEGAKIITSQMWPTGHRCSVQARPQ